MGGHRNLRGGNEQPSRHAEMHEQLLRGRATRFRRQVDDDVFAHTAHAADAEPRKRGGHFRGRRFERLLIVAEPGRDDAVPSDAAIDAVGDGFHFGEFWHGQI